MIMTHESQPTLTSLKGKFIINLILINTVVEYI